MSVLSVMNTVAIVQDQTFVKPSEDEFKMLEEKILAHINNRGPDKQYSWSLQDFQVGRPLGRGKFGRVYVAREKTTEYLVALKCLFKEELTKHHMEHQVIREIEIHMHLKHPNIIKLHTYFHDSKKIYLVLEYAAEGEVFGHLRNCGRFKEDRSAKYLYQVADALEYCHQNNVIHRDIKPENLLLDGNDNIKLADFGWSVHAPSNNRKTMCGTLDYLPPEMVQRKHYTKLVDNWCLGVLAYEFLFGKPPFESSKQERTYEKIVNVLVRYHENMITPLAKSFISDLLKYDPSKRMALKDVLVHPWITKYYSPPSQT